MRWLYVAMALFGGLMAGMQASINGALGKRIGGIEGVFVSFLVGTLSVFVALILLGRGNLNEVFTVPKGLLIGGIFGAIFITCNILSVPRIGVTAAISSAIVGQVLASLIIDHFALFGMTRNSINLSRLIGILLMMSGLYLVVKRNF
jgi:bacterial/archaeal transporter family-2 protein